MFLRLREHAVACNQMISGYSCFLGNFSAKCDTPGIEDMSSGEEISLITLGKLFELVYEGGSDISLSSSNEETMSPEMMGHLSGVEVP